MASSALVLALVLGAGAAGQTINQEEISKQNDIYQRWWGENFEWKFSELPTKGGVPDYRIPYSGYIYPDVNGGTVNALYKYDQAFNRGRRSAAGWERWDTSQTENEPVRRRGLFGRGRMVYRNRTPHWYGHCNGWTAAAIRHAEPQNSVVRNGVTFSPADIKALLAEIYIYRDSEMLAGSNNGYTLNPALIHVILTNYLGRKEYPVGMEGTPGKEKWNYPIYAYRSTSNRLNNRQVEVHTTLTYAYNTNGEYHKAPRKTRERSLHYILTLNENGEIIRGQNYRNSSRMDMLWLPLKPVPGGTDGNQRGNPHVNVDEVLAIWRASVPQDLRDKWVTIDPRPPVTETVAEEEAAETEPAAAASETDNNTAEENSDRNEARVVERETNTDDSREEQPASR